VRSESSFYVAFCSRVGWSSGSSQGSCCRCNRGCTLFAVRLGRISLFSLASSAFFSRLVNGLNNHDYLSVLDCPLPISKYPTPNPIIISPHEKYHSRKKFDNQIGCMAVVLCGQLADFECS
jgi:hypothetical protein